MTIGDREVAVVQQTVSGSAIEIERRTEAVKDRVGQAMLEVGFGALARAARHLAKQVCRSATLEHFTRLEQLPADQHGVSFAVTAPRAQDLNQNWHEFCDYLSLKTTN
ncbi:MAG: hypothetical protein ACE5KM_08030 [Planctomycetaceae bacterium]